MRGELSRIVVYGLIYLFYLVNPISLPRSQYTLCLMDFAPLFWPSQGVSRKRLRLRNTRESAAVDFANRKVGQTSCILASIAWNITFWRSGFYMKPSGRLSSDIFVQIANNRELAFCGEKAGNALVFASPAQRLVRRKERTGSPLSGANPPPERGTEGVGKPVSASTRKGLLR